MYNLQVAKAEQVFKIVDNVLKQVVGEKATLLFYNYLERHFSLRTNEFSTKLEVLAEGARLLCVGALIVERKILSALFLVAVCIAELKLTKIYQGKYDFARQVKLARASIFSKFNKNNFITYTHLFQTIYGATGT